MLCRATQDGQVTVKNSDKMWYPGRGNVNPLQYSCLENPMDTVKRQEDMALKDDPHPQVGRYPICYWGSVEVNY